MFSKLSKKELIRFIVQYDKYIQNFFETHEVVSMQYLLRVAIGKELLNNFKFLLKKY